jgi:tetratricopeptide (TPR) repeat protein
LQLKLELQGWSRILGGKIPMADIIQPNFGSRRLTVLVTILLLTFGVAQAADLISAREHFLHGHYSNCIVECQQAVAEREYEEEWRTLLVNSLCAVGQFQEAAAVISNALDRYSWSIPMRLLAHDILPFAGETNRAAEALREIEALLSARTDWRFRDAASLVAIGRSMLLLGADPRRVLDNIYEPARKANPGAREVYLAMGDLALDKHDSALAAKQFNAGLKSFAHDAEMHFGLARAFQSGDRKQMLRHATAALEQNTNHVGSMLLIAQHLIDAEEYDGASNLLERALSVNPWRPEAWAYRAVLSHLNNDAAGEKSARTNALKFWRTNPQVDFLIGQKLSQKYRFAEGAAYQRRSLAFDTNFVAAKAQLAQDLLRLGDENEGWRLAEEAHQEDEYDVTSFNLITLKDKLAKFRTITNADFIVRMGTNEAPIYGEEVLSLLSRAKSNLVTKYGIKLAQPTIVEIFPEQKDFGVRTFGMPDNPGFLGVCFGAVVTANSPASQTGHAANWQAVLWHEFTHVITLQMTRNKMPRWLSEGISVFEELQHNPTWGQRMTAKYREMILGDDFVPMSELSSAFLAPKTPLHLQFAYYESELAVEFIVKNYGFSALKRILRDLGKGIEINQAIAARTAPMEKLEDDFARFAQERAESLAPALDFEKPEPRELRSKEWQAEHPTNYWALQRIAIDAISRGQWSNAISPLLKLGEAYPLQTGDDSAWALLARAYRGLGDTNAERVALEKWVALDGEAYDAFERLSDLASAKKEWLVVHTNAARALAVNPLLPRPHRALAEAAEELGRDSEAIRANRILLLLDPPDPAQAHFRLARLLHKQRDGEAKREVLKALEEAPRFRDAHKLLREIRGQEPAQAGFAPSVQ